MCRPNQRQLCKSDETECDICLKRSFKSHPKAIYWHQEMNGDIKPEHVRKSSLDIFWFKCANTEHEPFKKKIASTVYNNSWCKECANVNRNKPKICKENNKSSFANSPKAKLWNYELNGDIKLENVFVSSNCEYWFTCDICNHNYKKSPNSISRSGCPYCAKSKLCSSSLIYKDYETCEICINRSFQTSPESKYFSDKNIDKDGNKINPRHLSKSGHHKYIFWHDCNHEFTRSLDSINVGTNSSFCPFCSGRELCGNCDSCIKKSFASIEKSKYLDPKYDAKLLFKNSSTKYPFNCAECNHTFKTTLFTISSDDTWCPYCSNKQLCEKSDKDGCLTCYNKSFASSTKSYMWADEDDPRRVFKRGSSKHYKFKCNFDHETTALPRNIDIYGGCKYCQNVTQTKLYEWLKSKFKYNILTEKTFDWCKKSGYQRFDFVIEDLQLIIELDGNQHFKQVWKWESPEITVDNDIYKMKKAIENDYSVIRILQMDIYLDKNDWQNKLFESIKIYLVPTIIYIGNDNNNYETHKKKMEQ